MVWRGKIERVGFCWLLFLCSLFFSPLVVAANCVEASAQATLKGPLTPQEVLDNPELASLLTRFEKEREIQKYDEV